MIIPESKLDGNGEPSVGAVQRGSAEQLTTSYPPPLPDAEPSAASHENGRAVAADASTAPTLRPPAITAGAVPAESAVAVSAATPERGGIGFTSVIRHLSLRGWLRWVYSNRSDATLRVRTREGGSGRIWCNGGIIIDAEWGTLGAEDALREMLSLASGAVTIDFDPVDRPRRIARGTHELLHLSERGHGRLSGMAQAEAALAASGAGGVRSEPFRSSLFIPLAGGAPAAHAGLLRPRMDSRRISRGEYLAGVFLLAALAVAAFAFGRLRAASEGATLAEAEATQTEQTRSGLLPPPPAEAQVSAAQPLIPFVGIEVEPPRAEIWLDQELIGLGRIQLAAIQDGQLHELRFMAPGYETKSLFFRDAPPGGRVVLSRSPEPVVISASAESPPSDTSASADSTASASTETSGAATEPQPERELARRAPRRRASTSAARAAAEPAPPAAKSVQAKKSPQVQLIEVQTPRVQILD
jgi:hypothetical protein